MGLLHPFQTSLETLRAHHWKYYTDPYVGCHFDCLYCLYRGANSYAKRIRPASADFSTQIAQELRAQPKGILDVGGVSDAYQPIEQERQVMRRLLLTLEESAQPVFILTKGSLVKRDADVLSRMAAEGLVHVCFSLISLDPSFTAAIEPGTAPPAERLNTARMLADRGVPISFHLAPMVPGLQSEDTEHQLLESMKTSGGSLVFSAMLGARRAYWSSLLDALNPTHFHDWTLFKSAYPDAARFDDQGKAQVCSPEYLARSMLRLRSRCLDLGLGFVCENVPGFTTVTLEEGIFRWKAPTVYDMARFIASQNASVTFERFYSEYWAAFEPDPDLQELVRMLWNDGALFTNTAIAPVQGSAGMQYVQGPQVLVEGGGTMTVSR